MLDGLITLAVIALSCALPFGLVVAGKRWHDRRISALVGRETRDY